MTLLAEGVLNSYWDQSIPVNLAHIAKAMQVRVALAAVGACAQLELPRSGRPRITINPDDPLERQRYGVAHALGHVALHHLRPGMAHVVHVSESYHLNVEVRMDAEANDFALRLLLPEAALRDSLAQLHHLEKLALLFQVAPVLIKQRMADLDLAWPRTLAQQLRPETTWD